MLPSLRRLLPLLLSSLCLACSPSLMQISSTIGTGQPQKAVIMLSELMNQHSDLTRPQLESVLKTLRQSRSFTPEMADDLIDRLKPEGRELILDWYMQVYLEQTERALSAGQFQQARLLWQRHQKVRQSALPDFQEKIPVLGLIDLREAEALLNRKQRTRAREAFKTARKRLTRKRPFDRLDQNFTYAALAQDLQHRLSRPDRSPPPHKIRTPKGR